MQGSSLASAFGHFLGTWYEPPGDIEDTLEIRHAFYAGATYMKNLVHQASKMSAPDAQAHMSRLYKELIDEAARNNAAPWIDRYLNRGASKTPAATPSQAMHMEPLAPQPGQEQQIDPNRHLVIAKTPVQPPPTPTGQVQEGTAQEQPMMWTLSMVREFEAAYRGAHAAQAPTFPFKDKTFRTVDAPTIINHLKSVFAADLAKPIPPKDQPPQQ